MGTSMHQTMIMGLQEWLVFAIFIALTVLVALLISQRKWYRSVSTNDFTPTPSTYKKTKWIYVPELQLIMFGLPLQVLWELAQFPLYTVWHEGDWGYILYGLIHCTLGDMLIMLSSYWLVALLNRTRYWYRIKILVNGFLFTLIGLGYTIYSELLNVNIKGTWAYTELMPIIPVIEIGGMPFMQWVLIPPVTLLLMRINYSSRSTELS